MKINILRFVLIVLLGMTFNTIFQFSSENADTSGRRSGAIIRYIIDIAPYTKNLSEETKQKLVERAQPIVRKLAHFSIYTLVGILIMSFTSTYNILLWKKFLISIGVGLTYAISDEFHQSFIPGRSAEIRDVMIDTSGVLLGILMIILLIVAFKAIKEKQKQKV